jgi:hypothetical protein
MLYSAPAAHAGLKPPRYGAKPAEAGWKLSSINLTTTIFREKSRSPIADTMSYVHASGCGAPHGHLA